MTCIKLNEEIPSFYRVTVYNNSTPIGTGIFNNYTFYSSSPEPKDNSHPLDIRLVEVAEFFYYLFGQKWSDSAKIKRGDSYRFITDANYCSGDYASKHAYGFAYDFNWSNQTAEKDIVAIIAHDVRTQGPIFKWLFALGVRGFGLYNTYIHLDFRPNPTGSGRYNGQKYNIWIKRDSSKQSDDKNRHEDFFNNYSIQPAEQQSQQTSETAKKKRYRSILIILLIILLTYGAYWIYNKGYLKRIF